MNHVTWLLFASIFPFISPQKVAGPFYIVNEGFFPRSYDGDFVSYTSEIKPMKDDYDDKRIHGQFYIKEKITKLRFIIQSWRESAKMWLGCGKQTEYPNLCNVFFSTKHFMKAFTGKVNPEDCSLEAGNYTLTNYTFELDLRDTIGNSMFFGHYKYSITIAGTTSAGVKDDGLKFDMMMWIKDLEEKKAGKNGKSGGGKSKNGEDNKQNQNKNKNKSNGKKN